MPDLYERIEMRRRRAIRVRALISGLKRQLLRLGGSLVVLAMLMTIANLPAIHAYFISRAESDLLEIDVVVPDPGSGAVDAHSRFLQQFMFAVVAEKETEDEELAMLAGDAEEAVDGVLEPAHETLEVELELPPDFDVHDIYLPSVQLAYRDQLLPAEEADVEDDQLLASFAADAVADWFADGAGEEDRVGFEVVGEGYADGTDHFTFRGEAGIDLHGVHEVTSVSIYGPAELELPEDDEAKEVHYQLVDQDGSSVPAAGWESSSLPDGVQFSSGKLVIDADSEIGSLSVEGTTEKSDGRALTAALDVELLSAAGAEDDESPSLEEAEGEIHGSSLILIPEEDAVSEYEYELIADGEPVPGASWEMEDSAAGTVMTSDGILQVDDEAHPGELEIVAHWPASGEDGDDDTALHASLTAELFHPEPTDISVQAPAEIAIPAAEDGEDAVAVHELKVSVLDQQGNALSDAESIISLDEHPTGVELDEDAAELTVSSEAPAEVMEFSATSKADSDVAIEFEIELVSDTDGEDAGEESEPSNGDEADEGSDENTDDDSDEDSDTNDEDADDPDDSPDEDSDDESDDEDDDSSDEEADDDPDEESEPSDGDEADEDSDGSDDDSDDQPEGDEQGDPARREESDDGESMDEDDSDDGDEGSDDDGADD